MNIYRPDYIEKSQIEIRSIPITYRSTALLMEYTRYNCISRPVVLYSSRARLDGTLAVLRAKHPETGDVLVILETRVERSRMLRILLATGLGAVFGFQAWRLALDGYPVAMPWYGALWVFVRHVALGVAVGITSAPSWWKRGAGLGALLSLPSLIVLGAMDGAAAALTISLCAGSMAAGVIIAFLTDTICPRRKPESYDSERALRRPEIRRQPIELPPDASDTCRRLADGTRALEEIESERRRRDDAAFGQEAEDRIVWRELIELELQEIDDHLNHLQSDENKGR